LIHLLHTADWQIGRQYGQFDADDGALLAQARLDVVEAIARLAHERGVDAVLVAGDVFDTQGVSDRTIRRLFAALAAFGGPWIMIGGNHDAALADSVWSRAQLLGAIPHNVHVPLATAVLSLPEAGTGMAVLAAPLTQRHTYDDVTASFDNLDSPAGLARIGLAHGSITGRLPDTIDAANPIAADRAARARLDYLALGDWHGCLQIDPRTWYAGTPEQDRFRGNEPGYVLDVRIEAPGAVPVVERVPIGRYTWLSWAESIVVLSDIDALAARLAGLDASHVLQLELDGTLDVRAWDGLQDAVARAGARVRALRCDMSRLTLEPGDDDLAALGASGYVGAVAMQLRAMRDDTAQAAVARNAIRLLVQFERDATAAPGGPSSSNSPNAPVAPDVPGTRVAST
jgi:DNA repair exonuclease SbcCD nuclease subunit